MNRYSKKSQKELDTCDKRLQRIFTEVLQIVDHSVLEGYRGELKQNLMFSEGQSYLRFPYSKHNVKPSKAIDVIPYPTGFEDKETLCYLAGVVVGIAKKHGVEIRWGRNWDMDSDLKDNFFNDYAHYEILGE